MNTPTTNYIEIDGEGKYIEDTDCREMATQNAADIAEIKNKLTTQSVSYTPQETMGGTAIPAECFYSKNNNVVTFCVGINGGTGYGTLITLPIGWRPKGRVTIPASNNAGATIGIIQITSNGVASAYAISNGCYATLTYVVE